MENQAHGTRDFNRGRDNVTMTVAVYVTGKHAPPVLVLPRVCFQNNMLTGAPTVSTGSARPTSWSNERLFVDYLKYFNTCERPNTEYPVDIRKSRVPLVNPSHQHGKRKCHFLACIALPYVI
jgi:hypothetical protein